jgi:hypothetical protein
MNIAGISAYTATRAAAVDRPGRAESSSAGAVARPLNGGNAAEAGELSPEDQALLRKLQARDREVRQHEQAHLSAAGGLAISGASYTYQKGPDGVNYAVGGEVSIDVSPGRTPEETISRAQRIRAAALAPAEPSGQDRAVAAQASQMEQQARAELAQQSRAAASYARGAAEDAGGFLSVYA